jgi:hypothetical protein
MSEIDSRAACQEIEKLRLENSKLKEERLEPTDDWCLIPGCLARCTGNMPGWSS